MHYSASVHAYDVMDTVFVTAAVQSTPGIGETQAACVLRATTSVSGVGEQDPRLWMMDVLVALMESL